MFRIKNVTQTTDDSLTETPKRISIRYNLREEILKSVILAYLCYIKYNEINKSYSYVQEYAFYKNGFDSFIICVQNCAKENRYIICYD